ncbi:hypothetical protein SLS60_010835 [Paraconiothyrium brasiliense]|uniref:Uncharacterized protein n=1 Tax=Paraconiothyrium brasiliense TaxID=300254 RepID=A0ABR3QM56_9PLEO
MGSIESEKDSTEIFSSSTMNDKHNYALSADIQVSQVLPEKSADDEASERDDAAGLSASIASAPTALTTVHENIHSVCGPRDSDEDHAASKPPNHKRIRSLSLKDGMLQPPSKKLAGSLTAVPEPLNQVEIGSNIDPSNPSSVTATVDDDDGGRVVGGPASGNNLATNITLNGVGVGEDAGGTQASPENFAQPNMADAETEDHESWQRDWYNSKKTFAHTTLMSNTGRRGMEQFLGWEDIDVEKMFPKKGKYQDAEGNPLTRNEAMKIKVNEVHQAYIDARKAGTREVPLGWNGRDFRPGYDPSSLRGSQRNTPSSQAQVLPPAGPDDGVTTAGIKEASRSRKRQAATVVNKGNGVVSQTRSDLQAIHRQATEQLRETYKRRQGSTVTVTDPVEPVISTAVDRLVYGIVDRQMYLRIVRMLDDNPPIVEGDYTSIMTEIHEHRAKLATELQRTVKWEKGQDPMLLVAQEFPLDG